MNPIFAKKITVLFKSGTREDYTHVVRFYVREDEVVNKQVLYIAGEVEDVAGGRVNMFDKIPVEQIHMTIIDWYIPEE